MDPLLIIEIFVLFVFSIVGIAYLLHPETRREMKDKWQKDKRKAELELKLKQTRKKAGKHRSSGEISGMLMFTSIRRERRRKQLEEERFWRKYGL